MSLASSSYHLRDGGLADLPALLGRLLDGRRTFVVTDRNVGPLYGHRAAAALGAACFELPAGEEHKRWASAERIVRWLIEAGATRGDLVVALGGGVVTDIAGFAASITLRGLPWVAVPTTLLAMVDAAIGGKTGVDLDLGKNLIGSFWPPEDVIADPQALVTLDLRQLRSGLAEVIKAGMIAPSSLEHLLDAHLAALAAGEVRRAGELIGAAARVKIDVVALDAREAGPRAVLNLGHTLGHALEAATGYERFLHGEAVAWGLLAALRIARDRGLLATSEAQAWASRLDRLAPLPPLDDLDLAQLEPYLARDKKRRGKEVRWILPRLGGVVLDVTVDATELQTCFAALRSLPAAGPFAALF